MSIRRRIKLRILAISLISFVIALFFMGQNATAQNTQVAGTPQQHHIELEDLKQEMRALQNKIDSLEAANQETNSKLYEALSTDEKGKEWFNNIEITTKKGTGLTFKTVDGNYKLRSRLRGQFLASFIDPDGGDENLEFRIRRLRWLVDGNVFAEWFKYKIQVDFSDASFDLRDLIFEFAYNENFVPKVGQYKIPFNREVQNSSSALQLVERSIVNENFEYDRDIGFGLYGTDEKYWKYELFVGNGEGLNARERNDTGVLWAGRVSFDPLGGGEVEDITPNFAKKSSLLLGFAIAGLDISDISAEASGFAPIQDRFGDLGIAEGQVVSITADAAFKHPLFNIEGEYNGRWIGDEDPALNDRVYDQGFRVQGGIFLIPQTLEIAGRWAYVDFDDDVLAGLDSAWEITPGINYYLSKDHRWKVQLDYSHIRETAADGTDEDDNRVRAQLQAYF
ncbi:MAG: porin [Thermodesulfobacteriota bacterium]